MELTIHGKPIIYSGDECGIYKSHSQGLCTDYAVMNPEDLTEKINVLPRDQAISSLEGLKKLAQSQLQNQPRNTGFPILIQRPQPVDLSDVRKNLENTVKFCDLILEALE